MEPEFPSGALLHGSDSRERCREIYKQSGYPALTEAAQAAGLGRAATGMAYQTASRANIFRRDSGRVETLDQFQALMRYNDWQNDAYSTSPFDAICARGDLSPYAAAPSGCTDTKVRAQFHFVMRAHSSSWLCIISGFVIGVHGEILTCPLAARIPRCAHSFVLCCVHIACTYFIMAMYKQRL